MALTWHEVTKDLGGYLGSTLDVLNAVKCRFRIEIGPVARQSMGTETPLLPNDNQGS